jgi:hypothetical protein
VSSLELVDETHEDAFRSTSYAAVVRARSLVFALILVGCSCDGGTRASDAGRPPPSAPTPLDAQQRIVREWLRAQAVSDTHFGVHVLYTWIGDDEVEALRAGGTIAGPREEAPLDAALEGDDSLIAQHLREPACAGRRSAWPSAWAARLGAPTPAHLVRVELRPESLLLVYDARTSPPTIHFATDRGATAPFEEASHLPAIWAAVLFVHADETGAVSREYVLVNTTMIGRVSMASPETAGELRTARERLGRLAHDAPEADGTIRTSTLEHAWAALPATGATIDASFASAIPSNRYRLDRSGLREVIDALVDRSEPYEWRTSLPSEPRPQLFE